jgi:hypothetical protein
MNEFNNYDDALEFAQKSANTLQLDIAIRKVKSFGKVVYRTNFASKNDSDYATAEIVKPRG